jgi:NAD-dependent SIR2 family protein deacetylase
MLSPETFFSREFKEKYPNIYAEEVEPFVHSSFAGMQPTTSHRFCAYLARKGWLKRIYTQNVDGLHQKAGINLADFLVECHGSLERDDLVMYGDSLPKKFFDCVALDFDPTLSPDKKVDLLLTMGTSLRVAPFFAIPNLAPKRCHRVLVNRDLTNCLVDHPFRKSNSGMMRNSTTIGRHENVPLDPLWCDMPEARKKRWRQLLVNADCDDFVEEFNQRSDDILE